MSGDDWRAGDLALCVDDHDFDGEKMEVTRGSIYTVDWVGIGYDALSEEPRPALGLVEIKHLKYGGELFDARCFRKINPLSDEERDEFLADLNVPVRESRHA